jgi:hypothetical protein
MGATDDQMVLAHFIVSDDVERSRHFGVHRLEISRSG